MNVKSFYKQSHCANVAEIEKFVFQENKYTVLEKASEKVCSLLKRNTPVSKILEEIRNFLSHHYQASWWTFAWQRDSNIEQDVARYGRFLAWLGEPEDIVATDVVCEHTVTFKGEDLKLSQNVSMICKRDGQYYAYLINSGSAKRSMKGRSVHTCVSTDLSLMISKIVLEHTYPGISICQVFLRHSKDTHESILEHFEVSGTKTSNVFLCDYASFLLEDESFDFSGFSTQIQSVVDTPFVRNCYDCSCSTLCKVPKLEGCAFETEAQVSSVSPDASTYVMPSFTASQAEVVNHKKGPLRVCAGPGSGKTAVLIGRIKKLIDDGVAPEFILAVTFSNEAAEVLKQRCLSFCDAAYLPRICTLNSFGYNVLMENKDLFDRELNLLTQARKYAIIKNVLSLFPALTGASYEKTNGRCGLNQTLSNKLDLYFSCKSDAEFFEKVPSYGEDFIQFAHCYKNILDARDFITFDEQITLCNQLFKEHPEVLSIYQSIYKYICVDEYQDVNQSQVDMIYHLASAHGNLMVVGDDDQSIYGFRGASSSFMLDFTKQFPNAKTVVLQENFRSSAPLVQAAQALISHNEERIDKDISSTRELANAKLPYLVNGMGASTVNAVIKDVLKQGYSYGDIAILSTKNAPLEKLMHELDCPCVLAKSYLRLDPLFLYLHGCISTYYRPDDDEAMYILAGLFGVQNLIDRSCGSIYNTLLSKGYPSFDKATLTDEPIQKMLFKIGEVHGLLGDELSPDVLVKLIAYSIGLEHSAALPVILDQLEKQHIATQEKLYQYTSELLQYEDETRVDVFSSNKVTLITSHDSKGREFPVVLMLNDYGDNDSEEVRRLFYVAMTRPKDQLYVLSDKTNKILSEMPHEVWAPSV